MQHYSNSYFLAQQGLTLIKAAVVEILKNNYPNGLRNSQIGRALGIYMGHVGHEGHISRCILAMLEHESIVYQIQDNKEWKLTDNGTIILI
jgi:hypothetical protein